MQVNILTLLPAGVSECLVECVLSVMNLQPAQDVSPPVA